MGKEWHFGGRSSSRRARDATVDHHRRHRPSLPGCMSTLFQLFDFHSFHFTHFVFNKPHPSSFDLSHHPSLPKASHHGGEAPRNSLELDEASISFSRNKEENFQIQVGLQIKTSRNGSKKSKPSDQKHPNIDHIASDSPSAKTPNLLARLMGLDILPQTSSSPSFSDHRQPKSGACYHVSGTRSLPESPRVSSSRLSDVDRHHHRLSLQISLDKESIEICKEIKRGEENVSRRKVTLVDITNNNKKLEYGGKQEVGLSRSKVEKSSKRLKRTVVDEFNLKLKNQEVVMSRKQKPLWMPRPRPRPKRKAKTKPREEEEAFGCPTSNNLPNNLNRPTKFSVKKEPSLSTAKVPHEQPCSYPKGKQKVAAGDSGERNAVDSSDTTDGGASEFKYIKRILTSHGISMNNPISFPNWFSPSNPLDPSIFHHLETTAAAAMEEATRHRWNRRLLFHLVDEVLGEIFLKKSNWHVRRKGWELAEEVREKVEEFPRANCQVLEDIDALIDKDLGKWKKLEMEGIVRVLEFHILDSLLRETTAAIVSVQQRCRFVGMDLTSRESAMPKDS